MDACCGCLPATNYRKRKNRDTELSQSRQVSGYAFTGNNDMSPSSITRTKQSIVKKKGQGDARSSTTLKIKDAEAASKTFHNGGSIWRS